VLDVPGKSGSPGKALQLYTATGGRNQQWQLVPVVLADAVGDEQEVYALLSLQSGLALGCQTTQPGTPVVQATWSGGQDQLWLRIEESGVSSLANLAVSGTVVTAAGTAKGSAVTLQPDGGTALQRWTLTPPGA
jgi:hypothetical protein